MTRRTGLILDFGGVLTTSVPGCAAGFDRREGLPPGTFLRAIAVNPEGAALYADLERGAVTQTEWNERTGALLGIDGTDLLGRVLVDLHPEASVIAAARAARAAGIKVGILSNSLGMEPYDYNAGLLAHRLGDANVVTVEVDAAVAGAARTALHGAGLHPTVVKGDGAQGNWDRAPYDRILATCSVRRIPRAWVEQSRAGGEIVAPVTTLFGGGAVVRLTVNEDGNARGNVTRDAAFMRLRQQRFTAPGTDAYLPGDWPGDAEQSMTSLDPEEIGENWLAQLLVGSCVPDVFTRRAKEGDGWTWWLFDTAVTSWATVDSVPGAAEFDVRQSGPRRLWDEVEAAYRWWEEKGKPGYERLGLTVTASGEHHTWIDDPSTFWTL
ncbi:protein-L-isoaspartate(D-aspartate) O-methyltransferase [Streptomyces sp. H10-C2]|uniref:protein-L-isoaspartate(D-aspartate) O-methyltransferase n=1 Tax=unclassified Streptomyces TaxID=2593676 RepID=UPI0024BBBE2D|nr:MULTISPECIES: protein-L-isoaspartate(D-aspartate) O-methyltransferase [unclassified Streptomyces]MDJ0344991.1 protein-L-isoaspartate(D-aspartate) O-methyltransferase [Streptomyces sp. PH10-H1]MDJ0373928.1 protein-L-isoaspartate(D-aspartate) O-methyltransferase [Streptomyces sp. H10-C2]